MLKIVDRLVLQELRAPLLFGIAIFSLLVIGTVVLQEAARFVIKYQLPAEYFFKFVVLSSPQFVILAIPMGILLGTLLAVGRLSGDLEITALRACGVSLYRVMVPVFVTGILLSGIMFYGNERLVPFTNSELKDMQNLVTSGQSGAKQQRVSWPIRGRGGDLQWLLIASSVEGTRLENVKLFYFDADNEENDSYITADSAKWEGSKWEFYNPRWVLLRPGDEPLVLYGDDIKLPDFEITPQSLALRSKTPEDLTILQMQSLISQLLADGEFVPTDKEILEFRTKLYFKYAMPLTPLFFVCIAVPLGIKRQRSSSTMGMGLALLVVLLYYVMMTGCLKLGAAGVVPPMAAAWTPNAVLLLIGIVTMQQRERN